MEQVQQLVFNVQRFCLHDGPGIRTTVFLKGCPLQCLWCDNPESNSSVPELGFARASCNKCGKCLHACPEKAISWDVEGMPGIDRGRCTACGQCVSVCVPEALAIYGQHRTVQDVFQEVCRDTSFFRRSSGGVTVSGGEPLTCGSFVLALFRLCKEYSIHTCIETSGFANPQLLKEILSFTDLVLYDLKHMDEEQHRQLTGQSNSLILSNARIVVENPAQVRFRMPLIPGLNSGQDNISATARFLLALKGKEACIELMPYHRLGVGKYQALERPYPLDGLSSPDPRFVVSVQRAFEDAGVRCLVST